MPLFNKSVADIMGDFGKKITLLREVQTRENKNITARQMQIKDLKTLNYNAQAEISAADKAIVALSHFVKPVA